MADLAAQTMKLNATMEEVRDLLKRIIESTARLEKAAGIVEPVKVPVKPIGVFEPVEAAEAEAEVEAAEAEAEVEAAEAEAEVEAAAKAKQDKADAAAAKLNKGRGH